MDDIFKAFVVNKTGTEFVTEIKEVSLGDLSEGNVLIKVAYSSVNYKDGLASIPDGKILRSYPLIPGIDLSGTVVESKDERFNPGDPVIATSYEIGVSHHGGFSEYARIPGDWIVPLPEGFTLEEAMIFGTAGFTAGLSVHRLEENGLKPEKGKVLVTGATGGVGSIAVAMLAKRGYHVVASTGKETSADYLKSIGAAEVISRHEVIGEKNRALDQQLWAAAVDPVGGKTLSSILGKIEYNGAVAVSGLTGGTEVPTTVFPFILRGIQLIGIDSVYCPMDTRQLLWKRIASDLKPETVLERIKHEITLEELPRTLNAILQGKNLGRTIVKM